MSAVGSQLSVLMRWRETKGHIFRYDDWGQYSCRGAQAQSQATRHPKFNCKYYFANILP